MMVSCPGCNNRYSIDERKIPAQGSSLTCPECGMHWKIGAPAETPADQAAPEAGRAARQGAAGRTGRSRASKAPAESPRGAAPRPAARPAPPEPPVFTVHESSGSQSQPVTCPQCGHFFVPAASSGAAGRTARSGRPPRRILIIEDQKYFAELTREALEPDYETTIVSNVASAREAMSRESFELVILDLSLEEGQDGTQLLGSIRQKRIPVLVFTARDETDLYAGAWDSLKGAGATDILIKGVNVGEELKQKVGALLARTEAAAGA
ncbi:MAG TPA: response regulator [Candidatus Polarisedimenticolia bacterium]|nr:response regulator [Candidatus Polarisedimenticolia bacterium]